VCSSPKAPVYQKEERAPIVLTSADTAPSGQTAAARRKSKVRLDLNNANVFQGLMIPK